MCDDSDDVPSALSPVSRDDIVTHENFPEFVNLTVKKQLETNLLPLIAHVKAAFEAVVPMEVRSNLAPQQLRYGNPPFPHSRFVCSKGFPLLCRWFTQSAFPGISSKGGEALTLDNGCAGNVNLFPAFHLYK